MRRAYADDLLYKAVDGRLISLRRERGHKEVALLRHDLTDEESIEFLQQLSTRLNNLSNDLGKGRFDLLQQVPKDSDVIASLKHQVRTSCAVPD